MPVPRDHLPPSGSVIKRRLHAGGPVEPVARRLAYHVGVYVGRRRVIHFTGESKKSKNVKVKNTSLASFLQGEKLRVVMTPKDKEHAKAVVAEAKRLINKKFRGDYDIVRNNCEHFSLHCYRVTYVEKVAEEGGGSGKRPKGRVRRQRGWGTQVKKVVKVVATFFAVVIIGGAVSAVKGALRRKGGPAQKRE